MYAEHFGFKEKPFSIKNNPDALYHNANYEGVYTAILSGILEPAGCVVLTGEGGIGKTALLRKLMAQDSKKELHFIYYPNTFWEFNDLLAHIARELHLNPEDLEQVQRLQALQDFLAAQSEEDKKVVLIFDNAHLLPDAVLRYLHLLFFSPTPAAGGLRMILVGLPLLEEKLELVSLQPLQERITVRCRLSPLPDTETAPFIEQQLQAAGYRGDTLFPPQVMATITRLARGIPCSIAALCDAALFLASLESAKIITPAIIEEAANLALISQESRSEQETPASESSPGFLPTLEDEPRVMEEDGKISEPADDFPDIDSDIQLPPLEFKFNENEERTGRIETSIEQAENPMSEDLITFTEEAIEEATEVLVDTPAVGESSQARLILGFDKDLEFAPGGPSVLCALVMNPSGTPFREVSVRCQSTRLTFSGHPRPRRIKLLGQRDASIVFLQYQGPESPLQTILTFQVEIRDHNGEWWAYKSDQDILLGFPDGSGGGKVKIRLAGKTNPRVELNKSAKPESAGQLIDNHSPLEPMSADNGATGQDFSLQQSGSLEQMVVVELAPDTERTELLRIEAASRTQYSTRGGFMARAILRSQNPDYAPERIELVSRPFMVFGRYNETSQVGFADFALGFVPQYLRISRLHCAICAMDDGLAIMHAGAHESSYTSLNNKRLMRGHWQRIESGDVIDISGFYGLRTVLAWDTLPSSPNDLSESIQGEKIGGSLLRTVDLLKQMQGDKSSTLREELKTCFGELIHQQDESATLNGVDSLGPLLYARFQRMDDKQQRVTHVYLPKWISIGSSPQAGLYVKAKGVMPKHADLLYRDNMYWIQDHAGLGDVRIGGHRLKLYEALPLEHGDIIDIGTARFVFESY